MDNVNKVTVTLYYQDPEQKPQDLESVLEAAEDALAKLTGSDLAISYLESGPVWEKSLYSPRY